MRTRTCPRCGATDISRSHRQSRFEVLLSQALRVWPVRCLECNYRWSVFSLYAPPTASESAHKVRQQGG